MDLDDARSRIKEIDRKLDQLYDTDFQSTSQEKILQRAKKAEQLEEEKRRLTGWLSNRKTDSSQSQL